MQLSARVKKHLFVALSDDIWQASEGEMADSQKALLSGSVEEIACIWSVSSSRITSGG
jgi:hypothetical protein